jgi:chromosome segregation ATPase
MSICASRGTTRKVRNEEMNRAKVWDSVSMQCEEMVSESSYLEVVKERDQLKTENEELKDDIEAHEAMKLTLKTDRNIFEDSCKRIATERDLIAAELNKTKVDHDNWCPHFHVKYQNMKVERDVLKAENEKLRECVESLKDAAKLQLQNLMFHKHLVYPGLEEALAHDDAKTGEISHNSKEKWDGLHDQADKEGEAK